MQEWEFWNLVKHNSNFLIYENKLSFEDMQKMNAVLEMGDDYEKAINQYHKEMAEIERQNKIR